MHRARQTQPGQACPLCGVIVCMLLAGLALGIPRVEAQAPAPVYCEPACRSGYRCELGECLPLCDPPCSEGFVCAAGGQCLPQAAGASQPASPGATPGLALACRPACRSSYVCIDGACVSRCNPPCAAGQICAPDGECALEPKQAAQDTPARVRSPSADSTLNFHFNPLDFLQFGVAPTLEFGSWIAMYVRVRPLNTGLASYLFLPGHDEDDFVWGLGGSVGVHIFTAEEGNMRGLFGGVALGYFYAQTRDKHGDLASFGTHALVPQLDVGYRWVFGHFLVGLAGRIGLAIPVAASDKPIGPTGCARPDSCDEKRSLLLPASLALDLGWFI